MDRIISPGRIFIAISLVVFGIQHFLYANFVATLVPAWVPGRLFWAYFVGVAFVAAAIGAVVPKMTRPAGILLGILFFLFVVTLHIPRIAAHSRDGNEWTSGFVALAMCGGAWILAGAASLEGKRETPFPFFRVGRYFFALAIVAFGVLHFLNEKLTVRVGPPWFPGRPLWAYLTGTALVVALLSPWPARCQEIQNSRFSAVGPRPGRIGSHSLLRSFCLSAARRRRERPRTKKQAIAPSVWLAQVERE